ncbi:GGDEF domain-containing protein [Pusillimonas caeni]|uniref:GGDEF domain-containing protein n=1 Tax=Pusillimonas caeni TaxID=1348472 RepID=UPI001075731E|nr:GGDEF domain-containing protein [Pusillimonas caeni]TFL13337.1 GGDEF domain-containing protein [Pusillimonas caeni]
MKLRGSFDVDAKTVFTIISLTILANGTVLAIAYRSLPDLLRPAARFWQWGTLLIALGCALFAFGEPLPRFVMLTLANGCMAFGLAFYSLALHEVNGIRPDPSLYAPALGVTIGIFWFSAVFPDFKIRVVIAALAWLALALTALQTLFKRPPEQFSSSRKLLIALFSLLFICTAVRLGIYTSMDLPADFHIETGASGWNLVSAIVLTMLPIVGTTAFLMLCSDMLRVRLEHAAATDFLTNLPNRRAVTERGAHMFNEAADSLGGFAVAVLDIDDFKSINDGFGHEAGDQALVHIANRLRQQIRSADMVARSGGEEFIALFKDMDAVHARAVVERMRRSIEGGHFRHADEAIPITVSAGLSARRHDDKSFEDILRRADKALFLAKSRGRNCIEVA